MKTFRNLDEQHREEWYVISDPHFFQRSITKHEPSRIDRFSVEPAMTYNMLSWWNERCSEDANIMLVGDFTFGGILKTLDFLENLNGHVYLIPGNHDHDKIIRRIESQAENLTVLDHIVEIEVTLREKGYPRVEQKELVVLSHYPMLSWNKMHYGSVHLHGHCHGNIDHMNRGTRRADIGYDSDMIDGEFPLSPRPFFDTVRKVLENPVSLGPDHHSTDKSSSRDK